MKGRYVALFIILLLVADQALKIYIKTHFRLGEEHIIIPDWFRLHFVENEGMAWGWKFGGDFGKIILTLFRMVAVILGTFYLRTIIQKKFHSGFIICAALIYAGAFGNLIDSLFYGLIFNNSNPFSLATLFPPEGGYTTFLHGRVVDMLYFPIITGKQYPQWFPFWHGQEFEFFSPVFNLADASISIGVIALLIWQKKFFPQKENDASSIVKTKTVVNDSTQMM